MKPKYISIFFILAATGSLILLAATLTGAPSAQENTVLLGLSMPRLVIGVTLLSSTILFTGLALCTRLNPTWALAANGALAARLSQTDNLFAGLFFAGFTVLTIPILAGLGLTLGFGQVVKRAAELFLWAEMLAGLTFGYLWLRFAHIYRQPGFFSDAPRKIARVTRIGRPIFWQIAGLLAFSALVLFLASPISMKRVPGHDSGIFLYFGRQILRGDLPFRDLWDHKPPMVFYVDALGLLLGGGSAWGVWLLEYLALASSTLLGFAVLRRYYGGLAATLGMSLSLGLVVFLLDGGNLTEEFSLPLQFGALMLVAISERRGWGGRGGAWRAVALGVAFTLALNFKQTMIGIWVALFLVLLLSAWRRHERAILHTFGRAALGALLTQAAIMLYYAAHQTLVEYWRVAFVYNLLYSDISEERRVRSLYYLWNFLASTSPIFPLAIFAWLGAGIKTARALMQRRANYYAFPLLVALIDLPIELVLIGVSGKTFRHYFMPLVPPVAILTAWGAQQLAQFLSSVIGRWRFSAWLPQIGVTLLTGVMLIPSFNALIVLSHPASEMTITTTVAMIERETAPDDYVLMWGSQTLINYLSNRTAPTRFVHQKALFRAGFASSALSDEMLGDLQAHPPKLIVNTRLPSTPFVTMDAAGRCSFPPNPPDGMQAVFAFICENYTLDQVITKDKWEVYKLQQ